MIDFETEFGLSLSIPGNTVDDGETIDLIVRPAFSGPFAGPENMEPVSPAYLVKPSKEVSLKEDMVVRIQHSAASLPEGDSHDLEFLIASYSPQHRGLFGPLYVFHKVIGKEEGRFDQDDKGYFGELQTNRFSWFMVWRKETRSSSGMDEEGGHLCLPGRKETRSSSGVDEEGGHLCLPGRKETRSSSGVDEEGGHLCLPSVYSARLYRGDAECRNKAVFCMCQQHPQYTKVRW